MKQRAKSPKFWMCLALLLCFISALGASIVQTSFGDVTIKDLRFETESGVQMSALLLVPDTASAENPAPAIITSHGWYNNREMQDLNYVEYARRGYVVLSIDMYGHGNSDNIPAGSWWQPEYGANGMYDAVKMIADLPYVDASKIGVTGHSNGARASRVAIGLDNEQEEQLIAAALFVSNDADYVDENGEFVDVYGARDIGVVACQYDEFFHRVAQEDGSRSAPRDYIHQATAQSFLHFGQNPEGLEARESYKIYEEQIDGETATRVIYNPNQIHPWAHFSATVVTSSVEFFENAFGAPNPIDASNQIWQVKTAFNTLGLVGFFMFIVSVTKVLVGTAVFASLKSKEEVKPQPALTGKSKTWFIVSSILAVIFSFVVYMFGYSKIAPNMPSFVTQSPPFFIGVWAALCGIFGIILVVIGAKVTGVKMDTVANGVKMDTKKICKTIALGLTVVALSYSIVFAADYFFKADFRIWVIAIKAFTVDKLPIILCYAPLFLIYYVLNSVVTNSYNYFEMGKKSWLNTAVNAFFNALPSALMIIVMYGCFYATGHLPNYFYPTFGGSIIGIWLFPIVIYLPLYAVISRKIFKATRNPYLPGIIMGLLVAIISCTNTLTQL